MTDFDEYAEEMARVSNPNDYGSLGSKLRVTRVGAYRQPSYGQITNPTYGQLPTRKASGRRIPNVTAGVNPTFNREWQGDNIYQGASRSVVRDGQSRRDADLPTLGQAIIEYGTARAQRKAALAEQQRGVEALAYARSKGIPDAPGLKGSPLSPPAPPLPPLRPPTPSDAYLSAQATALAQSKGIPAPPNAKGGPLAPPPAPTPVLPNQWNTKPPYIPPANVPAPPNAKGGPLAAPAAPIPNPPTQSLKPPSQLPPTPPRPANWSAPPLMAPPAAKGLPAPNANAPQSPSPSVPSSTPYVGPGSSTSWITPPKYVGPGSSMWQAGPGYQKTSEPADPLPSAPTTKKRKSTRSAKQTN